MEYFGRKSLYQSGASSLKDLGVRRILRVEVFVNATESSCSDEHVDYCRRHSLRTAGPTIHAKPYDGANIIYWIEK